MTKQKMRMILWQAMSDLKYSWNDDDKAIDEVIETQNRLMTAIDNMSIPDDNNEEL